MRTKLIVMIDDATRFRVKKFRHQREIGTEAEAIRMLVEHALDNPPKHQPDRNAVA